MPLFGASSASEAAAMATALSNVGFATPVSNTGNLITALSDVFPNYASNRAAKIAHHNETTDAVYNYMSSNYPSVVQTVDNSLGLTTENQVDTSGKKVSGSSSTGSGSGSGYVSVPSMAAVNYIDAPLAQQYGMSAATAYQEALANTAHQREMLDLQRAGLNPVLAARYSGAGVFSPDSMVTASGHSGSGGSGRSAKSSSGALPTLLGAIATIASGKTAVGAAVSTAAEAILPAFTDSK